MNIGTAQVCHAELVSASIFKELIQKPPTPPKYSGVSAASGLQRF
jgi:hypothetical protein